MCNLLALVALAALVIPFGAADNTFIGCYSAVPSDATLVPANEPLSEPRCSNVCGQAPYDTTYSLYHTDSSDCYCSSEGPDSADIEDGAEGDCADYQASVTTTTFAFQACASAVGRRGFAIVSNVQDCFTVCRSDLYALVQIYENDNYEFGCACLDDIPSTIYEEPSGTCPAGDYFIFQHSPDAAASGLSRRRLRAALNRRVGPTYCPVGLTACAIDGGYECIDTMTELESCGGCLDAQFGVSSGTRGQDCSSMGALMGHATCTSGTCVATACSDGLSLEDGACVPSLA
ncbi:hypothetical protein P7C73_g5867, partial [Tremellales sp. Uapishka_1]